MADNGPSTLPEFIAAIAELDVDALAVKNPVHANDEFRITIGMAKALQATNLERSFPNTAPTDENNTISIGFHKLFIGARAAFQHLTMLRKGENADLPKAIHRARISCNQFYEAAIVVYPYFDWACTDRTARLSKLENEAHETFDRIKEIFTQAEELAATEAVGKHVEAFGDASTSYSRSAVFWLIATAVMGGVALEAARRLFIDLHAPEATAATALYLVASKVVIVSVLFFGITWAARNYRASSHLAEVNAHRRRALQTYATLVRATEDPETRAAILKAATSCIFDHVDTGLTKGGADAPQPMQIVEIFKPRPGE